MTNKYDIISVNTLIKGVQEIAMQLEDKDFRKKTPASKKGRMQTDLQYMRSSLQTRLPKLDRHSPKFFPVGSHVVYHYTTVEHDWDDFSTHTVVPDKNGVVADHLTKKVLVQFEGEEHWVQVDPHHLKLRFIR